MSADPAELFNQAIDAMEEGERDRARKLLEVVVAMDERDGEAVLMLARLERDGEAQVEARARLESFLGHSTTHIDILVELADLCLEIGETSCAAGHLKTVLSERPNHWEALLLLGDAFTDAAAHAEATVAYQECLESNPFSSDAWFNLAASQEAQGNGPAAAAAYQGYLQVCTDAEDREQVMALISHLESS